MTGCSEPPAGRLWCCLTACWVWGCLASLVVSAAEGNHPSSVDDRDAAAAPAASIAELIRQLGSEKYIERNRAELELIAIGDEAFDQLKEAESSLDPEIAARARYLTRQLSVTWIREDDSLAVAQILQGYARMSPQERAQTIAQLASLPLEEGLVPLCRIARFDQLDEIAKRAALGIMQAPDARMNNEAMPDGANRSQQIVIHLGQSRRTSVAWLRTYAVELVDPGDAIEAWRQHVDQELVEVAMRDGDERRAISIQLMHHVSSVYEHLAIDDKLLELLLQMVELDEAGSHGVLERLVERLIRTKNWPVIDQIVDRYTERFRTQPILMYMLAQAGREQGDLERADELAEQAFRLPDSSDERIRVAIELDKRGLQDWAEREYRDVLAKEPALSIEGFYTASMLSAKLYDIERFMDSADLLDAYLEKIDKERKQGAEGRNFFFGEDDLGQRIEQMHARADYYRASHAHAEGDAATERKYLEMAIEHDPRDIDVLIAMYRLPLASDQTEFRADVARRIDAEAKQLDQEIRQWSEEARYYNNWAWLIANTRGDLDKAVRYAHRAVELANQESLPGFMDTLGRAYYAKGDLENALKYQRRALQLDPHTQQLQRQLELFEATSDDAS